METETSFVENENKKEFYLVGQTEYEEEIIYDVNLNDSMKINKYFRNNEISFEMENLESYYFYFFKESFYRIKVLDLGWEVNRKIEDFFLLKKTLEQKFPFLVIPNLQNHFKNKEIEKLNLIFFLDSVLNNIYLRNSEEISSFLKSTRIEFIKEMKINQDKQLIRKIHNLQTYFYKHEDENYFQNLIKELPSFKKKINLSNCHLLNEFNIDLENNLKEFKVYEKQIISLKSLITKNIEDLQNNIFQLKNNFDSMNSNLEKMDIYDTRFSSQINNPYLKYFKYFSIFFDDIKNKLSLFNSDFFEFFNYQNLETENLLNKNSFFQNLKKKLSKITIDNSNEKIEYDVQIFRAYLNNINKLNFQWSFYNRSKKFNQFFFNFIKRDIFFYSHVLEEYAELELMTDEFFNEIDNEENKINVKLNQNAEEIQE